MVSLANVLEHQTGGHESRNSKKEVVGGVIFRA